MSERILIVARLSPGSAPEVARLFGESDDGELPHALGVRRRELYQYRELYFHVVDFDGPAGQAMEQARDRADFRGLSEELSPHVVPYDPATWRGPADAMATRFYHWSPGGGAQ